jgi:hypothetical protein
LDAEFFVGNENISYPGSRSRRVQSRVRLEPFVDAVRGCHKSTAPSMLSTLSVQQERQLGAAFERAAFLFCAIDAGDSRYNAPSVNYVADFLALVEIPRIV